MKAAQLMRPDLLSLLLRLRGRAPPLACHLGKAPLDLRVAGFLLLLLTLGSFGSVVVDAGRHHDYSGHAFPISGPRGWFRVLRVTRAVAALNRKASAGISGPA